MDISLVDALVRAQAMPEQTLQAVRAQAGGQHHPLQNQGHLPCVYRFAQAIAPTGGFRAR